VELADALDSKSSGSNTMRVRFPPSAPDNKTFTESLFFIIISMKKMQYKNTALSLLKFSKT
jgi:hypothetical protein